MNTPPITEPAAVYTGDTWAWRKTLADYPASAGWVLKYTLINSAARINITGTADGDQHDIEVAATTTDGYTAGSYTYQAYVELGAERYTVGRGTITVLAGFSSGSGGADARTQAQIALDAALTAYASYTASRGTVDTYTIAGRSMKFRTVAEIAAQINFWRNEVYKERGGQLLPGSGKKILTRFGS